MKKFFKKSLAGTSALCLAATVTSCGNDQTETASDQLTYWVKLNSNAAILGVWGAEAYLNEIRLMPDQEGYVQIDLTGYDELVFVCKKQNKNFGVQFVLSTVHYRGMWASDYLYWIRYTLPEYPGEEGVAVT